MMVYSIASAALLRARAIKICAMAHPEAGDFCLNAQLASANACVLRLAAHTA